MLEFHIPIVKSVVAFNRDGCDAETPPINLRLALQDDRDNGGRFPDYGRGNGNGFDDDFWSEGCEMDRSPSMGPPFGRNPRDMQYMPDWEGKLYKDCSRSGNDDYNGRDEWDMDRPAKGRQTCQDDEGSDGQGQKNCDLENKGSSKALEKYGWNKMFSICELLKSRQKNKKAKKAFQALMELKQSMGTKMGGSVFQRGGACNGNASKAKSEYETFVMSLIPELKKLDDQQMRQFKWKVFQLIDDISSECDSNSGFDANSNCQMTTGKQNNHFVPSQTGIYDDQDRCSQDPMPMDQYGSRDMHSSWDRDAYMANQQQRHPYQQQSSQPYRPQQYHMHQHQQRYDPYDNQLQLVCQPPLICQPPCQPQCPPPCQPCCDSTSKQGDSEHRPSNASQRSTSHRSSYQYSNRSGSPSSQRRVHYN